VIPAQTGHLHVMSEVIGETYGDDDEQQGTRPGEGKNDAPATTGTHRGWGDPQSDELPDEPEDD
jgi:hypothetical protein